MRLNRKPFRAQWNVAVFETRRWAWFATPMRSQYTRFESIVFHTHATFERTMCNNNAKRRPLLYIVRQLKAIVIPWQCMRENALLYICLYANNSLQHTPIMLAYETPHCLYWCIRQQSAKFGNTHQCVDGIRPTRAGFNISNFSRPTDWEVTSHSLFEAARRWKQPYADLFSVYSKWCVLALLLLLFWISVPWHIPQYYKAKRIVKRESVPTATAIA